MTTRPEAPATHNDDGVDLTLIRWMLSLTPRQRVEHIQDLADSLDQIRAQNGDTQPH
jgi:hypothetical protein